MKRVVCVWEDASDLDDGPWTPRKDAAKAEPTIFHQVGYVFELTPDALVLTACVGDEHMAPRSRIPLGMIRSLIELVEGDPVKLPKKKRTTKAAL